VFFLNYIPLHVGDASGNSKNEKLVLDKELITEESLVCIANNGLRFDAPYSVKGQFRLITNFKVSLNPSRQV
jgi:hypothetical protein